MTLLAQALRRLGDTPSMMLFVSLLSITWGVLYLAVPQWTNPSTVYLLRWLLGSLPLAAAALIAAGGLGLFSYLWRIDLETRWLFSLPQEFVLALWVSGQVKAFVLGVIDDRFPVTAIGLSWGVWMLAFHTRAIMRGR